MIMKAWRSQICNELENQECGCVSLGLKVSRLTLYQGLIHLEVSISSSLYEGQPFYCIQTLADWTRITTIKRIHFT